MHHLLSYVHFSASILYLILGVLIVVKAPRSALNQASAGVLFSFFVWSFSTSWVHHPATPLPVARFFANVAAFGWLFYNTFHLWFTWYYTKKKPIHTILPFAVVVVGVPALLFVLQCTRASLFSEFEQQSYGWYTPWADSYWPAVYFVYSFSMAVIAFTVLFVHGRKSDSVYIRRQSVILICTGVFTLVSGFAINVILAFFLPGEVPPLADITLLVWASGLYYVSIRYRMLNITPFIAANRIITTMKDLLFLLDTHGNVMTVNSATLQILQCREHLLTGHSFRDLITRTQQEKDDILSAILRKEAFVVETELSFHSGPSIPVTLSTSLIPGTGVVCVAHDITLQKQRTELLNNAKKRLESRVSKATEDLQQANLRLMQEVAEKKLAAAALKESEERFRVIFECAPDGIFLIDTEGVLLDANNEALRIVGYEKEMLVDSNVIESGLLSEDDGITVHEELSREADEGEYADYKEISLCHRGGAMVPVEVSLYPLKLGEKSLFIGIVRDLSSRKEAEKEAENLRQELHQAQKMEAVGRLAGGIAHDFNNLLGGIVGYSGIVSKRLKNNFPDESAIMEKIIDVAKQASDRTAQLLAFARKGKYQVEPVDMQELVVEVVSLLEHTVDPRIVLEKRLDAKEAVVMGDRSQLHSALLNLGVNARDALPEGGRIVFSTETRDFHDMPYCDAGEPEKHTKPKRCIQIVVSDNGTGMDEDTRLKIFEPFFSTKEEDKGTGLGLASVYGTVKQHNGCIDVETSPGRGSSFVIRLPVAEDENAVSVKEADGATAAAGSTEGTILVVDDTPFVREMMEEALIDSGYHVYAFDNGYDAIEWYRINYSECNLVILDYTMPELNGNECFMALKKIFPGVRAIVTSGHTRDGDIGKVFDAGVRSFLQKPFDIDKMLRVVHEVMTEKNQR